MEKLYYFKYDGKDDDSESLGECYLIEGFIDMTEVLGVIKKDKITSKEKGYGFKLNLGENLIPLNVEMDMER